jgi:hypothetical protein
MGCTALALEGEAMMEHIKVTKPRQGEHEEGQEQE